MPEGSPQFALEPPRTTDELLSGLDSLHRETTAFLGELSTAEFLAPQGEHWSPAEHVRHLVTAVRAVAQGLAMPKLLLMLRFGVTFRGSRSFEEVRDLYGAALAAGGKAAGRYDPAARQIDMEPEDQRAFVMQRWQSAGDELDSAIRAWPEKSLDRYRAKHPLLGMMTVRELLYFTLYHNAHHARRIRERSIERES